MADFWRFWRQSKILMYLGKQPSQQKVNNGGGSRTAIDDNQPNKADGGSKPPPPPPLPPPQPKQTIDEKISAASGRPNKQNGGGGSGGESQLAITGIKDRKKSSPSIKAGESNHHNHPPQQPPPAVAAIERKPSGSVSSAAAVVNNKCNHIFNEKWDNVWRNTIEPKAAHWQGLVFVNPNFARTYYVPSSNFRCEFDSFNEYTPLNLEMMAHMRNDQYDKWMKTMIQTSSCHVSIHACQAVDLLDRFCVRCPNLTRLSLHYYYLDDNVLEFIRRHLPKLSYVNFENSIGPSMKSFQKFGQMQNLRHLILSGFDIYENSINKIFEYCQQLESLDLSNNCALTGHCLSHEAVKRLKRLNIQDCWRLTPDRLIEMVQRGLPALQELLCNSGINDKSLKAVAANCPGLFHLDISFEEFTYYDRSGLDVLSDAGFAAIGELRQLRMLRLRHVGRLTDDALNEIIGNCHNLLQLVLNLRHRHKLTDQRSLRRLAKSCPNLRCFEAVHTHFVARHCIDELSALSKTLQVLILRGDELVRDDDISLLVQTCSNLRFINLDGCPEIGENTLAVAVVHARKLPRGSNGHKPLFRASLVMTCVERSLINSLATEFPDNLRIRACDYRRNKVHYNEFDGREVHEYSLKDKFFPFYWYDYN